MTTLSTLLRLTLCMPVVLATQAHAQIEGTLFTSPDERVYLDYLRDEFLRNSAQQGFDIEEAAIPEIPEETAPAATGPAEYSFGGVLTQRNGQHSIWLNGTLIPQGDLPEGFRLVESGGVVSLRIAQDGETFLLRPGQRLNVANGAVSENSQRAVPIDTPQASAQGPQQEAISELARPLDQTSSNSAARSTAESQTSPEEAPEDFATTISELDDAEAEALFEALLERQEELSQPQETNEVEPREEDDL